MNPLMRFVIVAAAFLCRLRRPFRQVFLAFFLAGLALRAQPVSPAERVSLDAGWHFTKGDPEGLGSKLAYPEIKDWVEASGARFTTNAELAARTKPNGDPADDVSYAQNKFDDSQWRLLNLPHDWGIEGPFKQEYPGASGGTGNI